MKIHTTINSLRAESRAARVAHKRIGFVPTMGALHDGHLSLIRAAKSRCDLVVASIFVNPTQFGPNEDLAKYPRTFERDCQLLEKEKADLLFAPSVEEMYPQDAVTWVTVEGLSEKLDGKSRPGHFRGVTTVVAKLFHIVEPDIAFLGRKDAAQVAIIRRMVRDLKFRLKSLPVLSFREPDGLAMSSRNAYLDPTQRKAALVLSRALLEVEQKYEAGERDKNALIECGKQHIAKEPAARLDYLELVNADTLDPVAQATPGTMVAVAAYVGNTRLIDNLLLP
jgi:pantoate--beta-alanine ligase